MYKRILVAVDGSPTSLRGLDEAINLARAFDAELLLVHVVNELLVAPELAASACYEPIFLGPRESGLRVIEQAMNVARRAGVPCEPKLIDSLHALTAADEIVKQARELSADLIVIGTHGRRGLKRLAMGSDAELVLRQSPVPVLLVRDDEESA